MDIVFKCKPNRPKGVNNQNLNLNTTVWMMLFTQDIGSIWLAYREAGLIKRCYISESKADLYMF